MDNLVNNNDEMLDSGINEYDANIDLTLDEVDNINTFDDTVIDFYNTPSNDVDLEIKKHDIYGELKPYREQFIIPLEHIIRVEKNDNKN